MFIIPAILEGGDIDAAIAKHIELQRTRHEILSRIANSRPRALPASSGSTSGDARLSGDTTPRPVRAE